MLHLSSVCWLLGTYSCDVFNVCYVFVLQPTVQDRSDVGPRITLEVIASNVGSTTINNARLDIYYPAQFSATGSDLFFLLPERSVTTSVMPPSVRV